MKTAESIMTRNPCCCTPETRLTEVAEMMIEHDCGEIPVVDDLTNLRICGVLTDRDIVCRTLGEGKNPMDVMVEDIMTFPPVSVTPEASLEKCYQLMEENKIRRIPVVDDFDRICGIISLSDIVQKDRSHLDAILREVSTPGETSAPMS